MSDMLEKYKIFVYQMWQRNCIERDNWCQPQLTREEYEKQYSTYLEDNFWMQEVGSKVWSTQRSEYIEARN